MKRVNSNDIARLAGVSRSTVSRVINNYPNVPEETRQRVMKIIRENHYYPQLSGQMLNGMRNKTIGLFWLSRSSIALDSLSSSYFMNIIDAASARDYLVLSCVLDNLTDEKNIRFVRKVFMEGRIDGGIFIGPNSNDPLITELAEGGEIVGVFDFDTSSIQSTSLIAANFESDSGEHAVDYLYKLGHRRIAIIDGDMSRLSSFQRHESYMRSMLRHGLTLRNDWLTYGGITQKSGYQAAKRMLESCMGDLPTAICANNDAVAFGVYDACRELGLRIPEDISVIGIDGHSHGAEIQPPLTTIGFKFRSIFTSLTSRVIDAIEEQSDIPQAEAFTGVLIERASCREV